MIEITLSFSNEVARVTRRQTREAMKLMDLKMAGDIRDEDGTAALGWVGLRKVWAALDAAITAQERGREVEAIRIERANLPTVREERKAG
jgi:hypothetical protein